jgi:hypothetical protein
MDLALGSVQWRAPIFMVLLIINMDLGKMRFEDVTWI